MSLLGRDYTELEFTHDDITRTVYQRVSDEELDAAAARAKADDVTLLAFRFSGDSICPAVRFDRLERAFNGWLEGHVIPTPDAAHKLDDDAHSVLTYEFESANPNDAEHPTRQARRRLLEYLGERLLGT